MINDCRLIVALLVLFFVTLGCKGEGDPQPRGGDIRITQSANGKYVVQHYRADPHWADISEYFDSIEDARARQRYIEEGPIVVPKGDIK